MSIPTNSGNPLNPTFNLALNNAGSLPLDPDSVFSCNICLDSLKDKEPVVTQCGHLYCWPCLYRWLITRRSAANSTCPVCKAGVTQENVIPIFIRSEEEERDHKEKKTKRKNLSVPVAAPSLSPSNSSGTEAGIEEEEEEEDDTIPARPHAHRPDPVQLSAANGTSINNLSYGGSSFQPTVGYFPSLFGLQFHSFTPPSPPPSSSTTSPNSQSNPNDYNEMDRKEKAYLSRILYLLIFSVFFCLLLF